MAGNIDNRNFFRNSNSGGPGAPGMPSGGNAPSQQSGLVNEQLGEQLLNGLTMGNNKLNYEEFARRQAQLALNRDNARKAGTEIAAMNIKQGVNSAATAEEMGDYFLYTIDQKVTLPRQKSAMLPIINKDVDATKVSIYNETVHAKFPLLGLKFKNTTGQHLMQGPITVFEGNSYAGDARVMDLQPNEERLISYAIDLGTEVKPEGTSKPDELTAAKIVKGVVHASYKLRQTRAYRIKNRSEHDRTLVIEHPIRQDWKLITPEKPSERGRDVYRFQVNIGAGKEAVQDVVEELTRVNLIALNNLDDQNVQLFLRSPVTSPKVKKALEDAVQLRSKWSETQRLLTDAQQQLAAIRQDQERLRANLKEVPASSAAYKRYLEKFDKQETEIEKLQDDSKHLKETSEKQRKEYETFLIGLNVD